MTKKLAIVVFGIPYHVVVTRISIFREQRSHQLSNAVVYSQRHWTRLRKRKALNLLIGGALFANNVQVSNINAKFLLVSG